LGVWFLSSVYVDVDLGSFSVVESPVDYYVSSDAPPMPLDSSFDVYVNGGYVASLVMSPSWVEEAVVGFLVGEGMVKPGGIRSVVVSMESRSVLVEAVEFKGRTRFFFDDCVALASRASPVKSKLRVAWSALKELIEDFESRASKKQGVQATAVYDLSQNTGVIAYDVSRYVSAAKALGYTVKHGFKAEECVAVTTGRASGDLVASVANTGIPILVTTKNPIYSGYIAATTYKVTLIITTREKGETKPRILTWPERILTTNLN